MEVIQKNRKEGKTTELIEKANNYNGYIVCHSIPECQRIFRQAQEMKYKINFPISFSEFMRGELHTKNCSPLHIDNADTLFSYMTGSKIDTMTVTSEEK